MASLPPEKYDTEAINASVDMVTLVSRYTQLKKDGKEFKALCLFHEENTPSMTVSPSKNFLHCFGCGAHHDPISFLMAVEGIDFKESCKRLLNGSGTTGPVAIPEFPPRPKFKIPPPRITIPPPADNIKPDMTLKRLGDPVAVYPYYTQDGQPFGYVARYHDADTGKKTIRCWSYGNRTKSEPLAWACAHFSAPRPLYNQHLLIQRPTAQVLIVEGEKAADAATKLFPSLVCITWPGGADSLEHADWSLLEGRKCVLWPDNDAPGIDAMTRLARLLKQQKAVEIKGIRVTDLPESWDAADWTDDLPAPLEWAKPRVFTYSDDILQDENIPLPPEMPSLNQEHDATNPDDETTLEIAPQPPISAYSESEAQAAYLHIPEADAELTSLPTALSPAAPDITAARVTRDAELTTTSPRPMSLATTEKGALLMNLDNAVRAIQLDSDLIGHLWYDEFLDTIITDWQGKKRQWADADDIKLCLHLQRNIGLTRISTGQAHDAALLAALHDVRNEVKDYLNGLVWDGTPRLEHLLSDGFGTDHNAYTQAVGRCFMVSMVARALQPGCKVDTVMVLEGKQGKQKSSALAVLGGKWFVECHENVMSKDFYGVLTGHLLVEISEMHSFTRAEVERIKGIISCQVDRYRKAYARHTTDHPRQTVLVGTTNRDDYHKDETGGRRFLPVLCHEISLPWLRENRDQLFAEAVHRYNLAPKDATPEARLAAGAAWWDIPEQEQQAEINARRDVDSWEDSIEQWIHNTARSTVTVADILSDCLEIETKDHDQMRQKRVGRILRALGWINRPRRNENGRLHKVWMKE